jgi:hypothetical protein
MSMTRAGSGYMRSRPPQDLGDWLADGLFIDAMRALGHKPILHIGQTR